TFHGMARVKRTGNYDNFSFLSPRTQEIYDFCQGYGVTLAYETVEWAIYNRPGVFAKLKEECPNLKGVLDIKQTRLSGYDYKDYISDMGASLAYVHYSDVDENGNTCLAGRGIFDTDLLLKRLKDNGFDGAILIENYAKDFKALEELKESYLYLQEKIYKYGL
ncbi:MAG: sugar phosphate isomerase/epimerase, partial [Clostridia bacterium]|nr:sugar phosphate isomerase/epimerase [Clostridia bacterium]